MEMVRYNAADHVPHTIALEPVWVFPVAAPPIVDGCVTIAGGQIVAVGRAARRRGALSTWATWRSCPAWSTPTRTWSSADLAAPLGEPGMVLPDWIRQVMAHVGAARAHSRPQRSPGLHECLRPAPRPGRHRHDATGAPTPRRSEGRARGGHVSRVPSRRRRSALRGRLRRRGVSAARPTHRAYVRPAFSPHAPYTVHPELLESLVELARRHRVPLAMHLAESREELELLHTGGGPFRELLVELDAWDPAPNARLAFGSGLSGAAGPRAAGAGDSRQLSERRRDASFWPSMPRR